MSLLTIEQKEVIREQLRAYCEKYGSNNKAANSLHQVSPSTISSVMNGRWENISDEMWRNIRTQTTVATTENTTPRSVIVETTAVKDLLFCMTENQKNRSFIWAVSNAGSGKTVSTRLMRQHRNVFYVLCDEDMKKSDFAQELARAVGLRVNTQKKARTIIMEVIKYLQELDDVLIIFDEGDKLSDNVLHYFITIYNHLENVAAVQFISTSYMERRMELGLRYNKKGYRELWSRIGCKFYDVAQNTGHDVAAISRARGLTTQKEIDQVVEEAARFGMDLRRAERKIQALLGQRKHTTNPVNIPA